MSTEEYGVDIIVNEADVMEKGSVLHGIIDEVTTRWAKVKRTLIAEGTALLRSAQALIYVWRSVTKVMGITLDPMQEILLSYIATTVTTLISISTALHATGAGAPYAAYLMIVALAFNTIATAAALQGMAEAKQSYQEASDLMESLGMFATTLAAFG